MAGEVRLRAVEDADQDAFFELQQDPAVVAMAAVPARDREAFLAHWARVEADESAIRRTILLDGAVAGNLGSWSADGQRMVGYVVAPAYWGQGVATNALRLFLDEVPSRPLYAHVAVHNAGSARVLEKCGFKRDLELEANAPEAEDGIQEFIFVLA